jgi:hypothetical protein
VSLILDESADNDSDGGADITNNPAPIDPLQDSIRPFLLFPKLESPSDLFNLPTMLLLSCGLLFSRFLVSFKGGGFSLVCFLDREFQGLEVILLYFLHGRTIQNDSVSDDSGNSGAVHRCERWWAIPACADPEACPPGTTGEAAPTSSTAASSSPRQIYP